MSKRLRQEDGIALVMALSITVVLIIFVASMISYTSSNSRAAVKSSADLTAKQYAEAGLNGAYSILQNQTVVSGGNPAAANLLGCNGAGGAASTAGPSDCSVLSAKVVCVTAASCSLGDPGSASVFGYYSGTNPGAYNGVNVAASTWLLTSSGYARNPQGTTIVKTTTATVLIQPLNAGAVAAVWNHIFMTAPLVPNVCSVDFGGNNLIFTSPIYVIGNLCLSGQNDSIQENAAGQPIDLMVGGKLVLSGSGTSAGLSTHYLHSGVVVGGCTTVAVTSSTSACGTTTNYYVTTPDTFVPTEAPEMTPTEIAAAYTVADPGPKHPCVVVTGSLAPTQFDNDTTQNGTNPATFELLPAGGTYQCISQNGGATTGQLTWNGTTSVWNGVPAKTPWVSGRVFFDGNMTISSNGTYVGTGAIDVAGTITFNGNATTLCATNPCNTATGAWQGTSGNNSMLTLVALASNTTSISFTNNSQTFQGSLWSQPSSTMTFVKNGVTVEGPMSIGKFDNSFNNASFIPLPVITNMPVGAPLPPNTGATVGTLTITR
jgi:Tfp pilus assembly protein PilX